MEQIEKSVKSFWTNNWRWVATVVFFAGVNFATIQMNIDNKLDEDEAHNIVNTTINEKVTPLIKENSEAINNNASIIDHMKKEDATNISLAKEIKYNLKALMKANGLEYIEDTNK